MYNNRELRGRAWNALRGKWNIFYPIMLLSVVFTDAFGLKIVYSNFFSRYISWPVNLLGNELTYAIAIPVGFGCVLAGIALAFTLSGLALNAGEYRVASAVTDHDTISVGLLFPRAYFFKALIMNLVQYLLIILGSMLFVIPGIICSCNYAMANYLLINDPTLGPIEALRLSRERMYGKRMTFFSLQLSFLPWAFAIYLLLSAVSSLVYNLTWQGDVIYSIVSWASTAFLLGYMRVTTYIFFKDTENERATFQNSEPFATESRSDSESEAREKAAREAEERRSREAEAETIYRRYRCSHEAMGAAGELEHYRTLNLSSYREDALRAQYGRELMLRFDREPEAFDQLIALCEEYSIDGLTDRMIARLYRYDREHNIKPDALLSMVERTLAMLHSGAFAQDPGFAARKQTDLLKLTDSIKTSAEESDPEGAWKEHYRSICELCGFSEE